MADRDKYFEKAEAVASEALNLDSQCLRSCSGNPCPHFDQISEAIARFARESAAEARKEAFEEAAQEVDGELRQICEEEHLPKGIMGQMQQVCKEQTDCFDLDRLRKTLRARATESKPATEERP